MFRIADYLFTPSDLAVLWHALSARGQLHHVIDALSLVILIAGMRLFDFGGASILALLFLTWKVATPRVRVTDALDLLTLAHCLWLIHYLFDAGEETLFFLAFLVVLFRWRLDSRVSIGAALACLVAIPVSLILFQIRWWPAGEAWAETFAVWAYYFLAMGVLRQIVELAGRRAQQSS